MSFWEKYREIFIKRFLFDVVCGGDGRSREFRALRKAHDELFAGATDDDLKEFVRQTKRYMPSFVDGDFNSVLTMAEEMRTYSRRRLENPRRW